MMAAERKKEREREEERKGGEVMYAPEVPAIHRRSLWQDKPNPNNPQLAVNHPE